MMPRNKALLSCNLLLYSFFVDHRTPSLNVGLARDIRKEGEEAAHGLAYKSRCAMRLMLV
ncbi:hypothetical protein B8Y94_16440 [Salmonella enterica]|nr:hypothetical protein [Salmonella enterica]EAQ3153656.1 hypothetical protein [Salmonella enterica]EAY1693766.1 hypothetical protein [Salmonella enterica]EBH7275956.1 hypothetical protein [Salmonella enterica]EBR4457890.1 hypothetical protein [Salmonella enterica]